MISFLTCKAKAVLRLIIELSYQKKNGDISTKEIEVSSDKIYKITVADNMTGLSTYNARIIGYTMCESPNKASYFATEYSKPTIVDTIKIDYSEDNVSRRISINVSDIRSIEELSTSGFDEIVNREIPTFR